MLHSSVENYSCLVLIDKSSNQRECIGFTANFSQKKSYSENYLLFKNDAVGKRPTAYGNHL